MSKSSLPGHPAGASYRPLTFRRRAFRLAALSLPLAALSLVCASCLNPEDDYNAYAERAADAKAPMSIVGTQDSGVDAASLQAPDASFDDTSLAMICLSQLAQDVSKALLWKLELQYDKANSQLTYTSFSLAAGSTDINSPISGSQIGPKSGQVLSNGSAEIDLPDTTLPAAQNGITGVPVPLIKVKVLFHVESATQICANLGATVTEPSTVTLQPAQNPCLVLPTDKSGKWGPVATGDIHCP